MNKRVNNKLYGNTEKKVELNMMKEMKDALADAERERDRVSKALSSLSGLSKTAESSANNFSVALLEAKKLQKAIRELGLPDDEFVDRVVKVGDANVKQMNDAASALKAIEKL